VGAKFHPFDELFLKATIAHEIGHALGLEHEGSKGTIMAEGVWQGTYPGPENPDPSKPDPRELYVEFIEYNRDKLNFKTKLTINLRDFTGD